jgi:heme-degrading monooxygenase HmoA
MRELAMNKYGCIELTSICEDNYEITISYWKSLENIRQWKRNEEHVEAQENGKARWYKSYHVQVVKVVREYRSST